MKNFLLIILCIGAAACSSTKENVPTLKSGILLQYMDTTVRPGDNFTAYVNGSWVKETKIPADKSSFGIFNILRDESEENVKTIIEESSKGDFEKGSDEQKVGDLYNSYMNVDLRNKLGLAPIKPLFEKIDQISNYDDLAVYMAYANKYGFSVPFHVFIYQDFKIPTEHAIYTYQGGLGLPDREYYLKEDDRSIEIKEKYVEHIAKMLELAELPSPTESAEKIMGIETALAEKHYTKEASRDYVGLYNKVDVSALDTIMSKFNWKAYFTEVGIPDQKELVVLMLDYIQALDNIIFSTDIESWKTYLKWSALNETASRLTTALDEQNFSFYSKELRGVEEQKPMWRRGVGVVNGSLGEVIGKVYVDRYFPPAAKSRMEELVKNLLKAYELSINDLDWMSDSTKAKALDKLSKFTYKIGYPNKWKDYSKMDIDAEDFFGNRMRVSLFDYDEQLDKLGKPVDREEWGMTPQTVNAYYSPSKNEIVFPAAILQPPFFDMEADDAVNYGAIGAIIGHEIGHGFDDKGSTFDGDGALNNWWTEEDRAEFEARTGKLVGQYNDYEVLPGVNVNGEFTLGENIGDLGGLTITYKAYKASLNGAEGKVMDGFTADQRLFIGYAQAWRGKSRDEALRTQVATDPHSPRDFRVNGIVKNVPAFYEAFNIKETDSLYLAPEDRVKIW
ncbi:M13 family metallopeptidase [Reichenbachiella versicolor]|uniref:M13 family metallopeptidase n=1 Tax=Reichenbachiella versicolor TaxID=1821036 RepID=UPI000D6E8694|nr:M13 family metallopeptidase [Reichenbachiella versicolor]